MNNDQKKNPNNNPNKRNFNGLIILLAWAAILTIGLNYLPS